MIDTHTHIYLPEFGDEISDVMTRSMASGVSHFILPNIDLESLPQVKELHKRFPIVTSMAMGLHPTEVKEDWETVVDFIEVEIDKGECVAVGEIGMDLYWDKTFIREQKAAFQRQMKIAERLHLPIIIHSRNAFEEILEVIENTGPTVPLIFHSFTGSRVNVRRIREVCDPYFGINGVVTYKNAPELREALPEIGLDRIILETDSPYLTPVPHRGKRNESSYLGFICNQIAESLKITSSEVENATDANACLIFGL